MVEKGSIIHGRSRYGSFEAKKNFIDLKSILSKLDSTKIFLKKELKVKGSDLNIPYYTNCEKPKILLISSVHGDEPDTAYFFSKLLIAECFKFTTINIYPNC